MEIIVSNACAAPLYEQIKEQLKNKILSGELEQGAPLPSIRLMARELRVSIITVKRAYDDLEAQGFLETVPAKGTFVAVHNQELMRNIAVAQIEEKLSDAVSASRSIQMPLEELLEIVRLLYEDLGQDSQDPP